ncbi:MAG: radical SAM protein [Candidatus Sigynarchaeum springense]
MSRNILFIYPPITNETSRGLESNLISGSTISPEISFLYLETYLRSKIPGIEIAYLDFRIEDMNDAENTLSNVLNEGMFGYVGITCYSCHYLTSIAIARIVKKINKDIVIIIGGFHPTTCPDDFTFPGSPIDYVVRGEGEISLYQILARGDKVVSSPRVVEGTQIDKLDEIPPISLELFEKYKEKMDFSDLPVYFSRGCTFDCSFCISREGTCGLKRYRVLSPSKAITQLEILESYNPNRITIMDSLFGANRKWFDTITSLMQKKNRPYKVKVEAHVDILSDEKLHALIKSGIDLTVGFENASPQQLVLMNKTKDPMRYIYNMNRIIDTFFHSGRELVVNILIGFPGETRRTIDETFAFLARSSPKLDSTLLKFSLFRIYPGTPVFRYTPFFHDVFGSIFYTKDWWYHDVDHSLFPSIVDPSRHLDLISEITYVRDKINTLYADLVSRGGVSSVTYKLAFIRHLSRVNRSYDGLKDRIVNLRNSVPKKFPSLAL